LPNPGFNQTATFKNKTTGGANMKKQTEQRKTFNRLKLMAVPFLSCYYASRHISNCFFNTNLKVITHQNLINWVYDDFNLNEKEVTNENQ